MSWRDDGGALPESTLRTALERFGDMFEPGRDVIVARAPGRLDVMGGIADYSGSLVLEWPLAAATFVAMQACDEPTLEVVTACDDCDASGIDTHVRLPLDDVAGDYASVRSRFAQDPKRHWLAYVVGALTVIANECGARSKKGLRILVASDVPSGKGVSSSAALEVASMRALDCLLGTGIGERELALLAQRIENQVAGAPCGVMDQMTSAFGREGSLLALLCQPAELEAQVELPEGLAVFGIDSGVRHEVKGSDYASVRIGAFMGYRIVAALAGLRCTDLANGQVAIDDPRWRGYLANVTPEQWSRFERGVPESMLGRDFLAAYGGISDPITRVSPDRVYAVRAPAAHPIHEHARVREFRALLETSPLPDRMRERLGELMYASHASYGACGLGSQGTDRLVERVRHAGSDHGLFGAKITGGGSGGTVAVLARSDAAPAVRAVAADYARETGRGGFVLEGSSDGALASRIRRVRR